MIHLTTFEPYSLRDLEASIHGVRKEIHDRQITISQMRRFKQGKGSSTFDKATMIERGRKADNEILVLHVIKSELIYLYELSRLKVKGKDSK